jgi:hypothetical protein
MKRGIATLLSLCVLVTVAYFTASKWAIKHETLTFYDATRDNRPVAVDVAVRRDKEMQANAGMITLPVATPSNSPNILSSQTCSPRVATSWSASSMICRPIRRW